MSQVARRLKQISDLLCFEMMKAVIFTWGKKFHVENVKKYRLDISHGLLYFWAKMACG